MDAVVDTFVALVVNAVIGLASQIRICSEYALTPSVPALLRATQLRCPCIPHTPENSLRQLPDHLHDPVGDAFQFRVDLGQFARRLEHVEVPVEGDLVADLGFVVVDPGIGDVRQDFPLEVRRRYLRSAAHPRCRAAWCRAWAGLSFCPWSP